MADFPFCFKSNSRSAICRGAVWKGFLDGIEAPQSLARSMPVAVTSTIARASYGITFRADFDDNTHLREDKTWDEYELRWKANNQITWFLKKVCSRSSRQYGIVLT